MSDVEDDASIRRTFDRKAWICNIPECDVASGVEASPSIRALKRYVEETIRQLSGPKSGRWERYSDDLGLTAYRYFANWDDT